MRKLHRDISSVIGVSLFLAGVLGSTFFYVGALWGFDRGWQPIALWYVAAAAGTWTTAIGEDWLPKRERICGRTLELLDAVRAPLAAFLLLQVIVLPTLGVIWICRECPAWVIYVLVSAALLAAVSAGLRLVIVLVARRP